MQKYLITSRVENFLYQQIQEHRPSFALYRDKSNPNYNTQAIDFVEVCSQFEDMKSFIHRDADLAEKLGATGVHLTSTQFDTIKYAKSLALEVIVSTHTHEEVLLAQKLGADYVTYSPIFKSPNKGEPKGIENLQELLKKCDIKVFALGGIVNEKEIEEIKKTESFGFASIRYFY